MQPVLVRLPNWVGDVVMALPALQHLVDHGFAPRLVGKRWAGALLAGHREGSFGSIDARPATFAAAVNQWRALRKAARDDDDQFDRRVNSLLLTNSFSSAAEVWFAGLRPIGYGQDGRSWMLSRAIKPTGGQAHEMHRFWRLATALTGRIDPPPASLHLAVASAAHQAADALLAGQGVDAPFACLVPFATGTMAGQSKAWPAFASFAAELARRMPVVVVPGPNEVTAARRDFPAAHCLEDVDLGVYAALLARAQVVVANDTGPGHIAAAVGAPLVSVLGPTNAARYRPLGDRAHTVQGNPWPTVAAVDEAVTHALAAGGPAILRATHGAGQQLAAGG